MKISSLYSVTSVPHLFQTSLLSGSRARHFVSRIHSSFVLLRPAGSEVRRQAWPQSRTAVWPRRQGVQTGAYIGRFVGPVRRAVIQTICSTSFRIYSMLAMQ